MIKKKSELNKSEKLLLLKAIENGEVDLKSLTPDTLYACEYSDYFQGLMIAGNQEKEDTEITVICLGESRIARDLMTKIGSIELVGPGMKVTETIKLTKDNYL
jgi:hypothetical protein